MDADLDTIYNEFNGGISDPNIAPAANIQGSKLADASVPGTKIAAAPNGIGTAELNDGTVTTAKLADAPNGITTAKINDVQVTTGKIAVGATSVGAVVGGTDTPTGVGPDTETVIMEVVQATPSRGGVIQIMAAINGIAGSLGLTNCQLTVRLRMDGTAATPDGTVLMTAIQKINSPMASGEVLPFCFVLPQLEAGAGAGVAHRFKVTSIRNNTNLAWTAQGMRLTVIEWA